VPRSRPASRVDRQVAALWAVAASGTVLLRPVWLVLARFAPPCPWHRLTGLPCPGCGTTRALVALLEGRPATALAMNPLAAIAAVGFVLAGLAAPLWVAAGAPVPDLQARLRPAWTLAAAAAVALNWAWLVASGV
jgi:uncharacterized protein DUF2752